MGRLLCIAVLVGGCGDASTGTTDVGSTGSTSAAVPPGSTSGDTTTSTQSTGASTGGADTTTAEPPATTSSTGGESSGTTGGVGGPFPQTCAEAVADNTSIGCVFYPLALPAGGDATFVVSNVSASDASVTLSSVGGVVDFALVGPGEVGFFRDEGAQQMEVGTAAGTNGYTIESDRPLQVYSFFPARASGTADASIVLPGHTLRERHRVVAYNDLAPTSNTQYAAVVATEDDTAVTFTLQQAGSELTDPDGTVVLSYPGMLEVTLDRLETWVVSGEKWTATAAPNRLTGSVVESDKPIAVYSGNNVTYVPANPEDPDEFFCCGDAIATAVPPVEVYGREYAAVKFLPLGPEPDLWRFLAEHDATTITLTGDVDQVIALDAGEFEDILTPGNFVATGNRAFAMTHFMTGGHLTEHTAYEPYDCDGVPLGNPMTWPGDPTLEWAYPRANWIDGYVFPVGPTIGAGLPWCNDHATIVAPLEAWDGVTLDGFPLPAAIPLGESDLGYAYVALPDPWGRLEAPEGVGAEISVYGYFSAGSYMYPGGMGLNEVDPV